MIDSCPDCGAEGKALTALDWYIIHEDGCPRKSEQTLGVEMEHGLVEAIKSNSLPTCLHCGVEITKENDSGWEHFTAESGGRKTQKVCKACDKKHQPTQEDVKRIFEEIDKKEENKKR